MSKKTKKALPKVPDPVYHVLLTRLASTGAALRTPTIEGMTTELPTVGRGFHLVGKALDPQASFRWLHTSEVTEVAESPIRFSTRNSKYLLEIIPDEEEL